MNGLKAVRFAPTEAAQKPDTPGPEGRIDRAQGSAHPAGETLEGYAVEPDRAEPDAGLAEPDAANPDASAQAEAAAKLALADAAQPATGQPTGVSAVDLSELDALPEEV